MKDRVPTGSYLNGFVCAFLILLLLVLPLAQVASAHPQSATDRSQTKERTLPTSSLEFTPIVVEADEETGQFSQKVDSNNLTSNFDLMNEVTKQSNLRLSSEVDEATGALVYRYDIEVPPGRRGIVPDLALVYNSPRVADDSIVGAGWSLSIPSIERMNRTGSNTLYSTDYFASDLDGELISAGAGIFGAKHENGKFLKYTFVNNAWTVVDKKGTLYKFGNSAAARQDNPNDSTKVFKWMLEEVRDTNNNYLRYEYYKEGGQIYPSRIIYTGNGSNDGPLEVSFGREHRPYAPDLYNTGFSVRSNYRINEIRTEVNSVWAKKYKLSYSTGDNTSSSLLGSIIESGQDDFGIVVTLPATSFDYSTSPTDWRNSPPFSMPLTLDNPNEKVGVRIADINGDGLIDILCHNDKSNGPCSRDSPAIYLHNGSGWTNAITTWSFPPIANLP